MRRSGDIAIFSSRSPALAWLSVSGTSGSNPLSSSGESTVNLTSGASIDDRRGSRHGIADEIERVLDQNEEIDPAHLTGVLLRLGKSELSLRLRLPL